jgi:murein DD-endopeptidase MepM/ murein hydrolase activator NlpD
MGSKSLQFASFRPSASVAEPRKLRRAAGWSLRFPRIGRFLRAWRRMKSKSYTLFIAANDSGGVRRLRIPLYLLHVLLALAVVGGLTVIFAAGSYSRMLWKVTNYNTLRREQTSLKKQYLDLQSQVKDTNERLTSLQSLASEVAMAYGITNLRQTPFAITDSYQGPETQFRQSVAEFNYLQTNASMVEAASPNLRLMPAPQFASSSAAPSLWPVVGEITGRFGERLDPFSGEGAFHAGVDIASHLGDAVRSTADGVVTVVDRRAGYGRLVVIDHGFGVTTWYGHMLDFNTNVGAQVKRGDIIGFEGATGHATGPHVHYEVRFYNTPVNPWRYLRGAEVAPTQNGD